ncbi:MAG: hypothetical protein OXG49_08365 [Chloroflexi bacterium]|nr:hypothetical protein [Chloroflexota bacterium]
MIRQEIRQPDFAEIGCRFLADSQLTRWRRSGFGILYVRGSIYIGQLADPQTDLDFATPPSAAEPM